MALMRAMVLERLRTPLVMQERPLPQPAAGEVLIEVLACGVCRTDLHVVDGELPHPKLPIVPGHEIVGRVAALGSDVTDLTLGARVGVPWLAAACGVLAGEPSVEATFGEPVWLPRRRPRVVAVTLEDETGALARLQATLAGALVAGFIGNNGLLYVIINNQISFGNYYLLITGLLLVFAIIRHPEGIAGVAQEGLKGLVRRRRHLDAGSAPPELRTQLAAAEPQPERTA